MGKLGRNRRTRLWIFLFTAAVMVCQAGCLWVAAGAAAGGAAGYAYYRGKNCQSFPAGFEDSWAATRTALCDLGMPVLKEERNQGCGTIKTQTSDGDRVKIDLEVIPSRIPAEGMVTHICVRVGTFGDHPVSERVLYQVGAHLTAGPAVMPPSPGVATMPPIAPVPSSGQTTEPPLTSPSAAQSSPSPSSLPHEPIRVP
jgi:Protein of unknown function (DUF3568)